VDWLKRKSPATPIMEVKPATVAKNSGGEGGIRNFAPDFISDWANQFYQAKK